MSGENETLEQVHRAIAAGAAVCLIGAGFSQGTSTASGGEVPSSEDLINELKKLFAIPVDESPSLAEVADYASEVNDGNRKITSHLIQRLTSTQPNEDQIWIISQKWRAIFTTNFDDAIERVVVPNRIPVTPISDVKTIPPELTPIYYLHGRALDARETDIDPKIVISETNYLSLEKANKDLYAKLFNEIVCAKSIVIIGYSLRDLQIASGFLSAGEGVREKTVIITGPDSTEFTQSRLRKFGTVLPIGINGLVNCLNSFPQVAHSEDLQFLREDRGYSPASENEAEDFLRLVIRGELDGSKFLRQQVSDSEPYCVVRSEIEIIEKSSINRFIISADFGNGKSVFLKQAAISFFRRGFRVLWVETRLPEVFPEIEAVLRTGEPVAFLIDDMLRYRDVATFIGERMHGQSVLLVTTRGDQDVRFEEIASRLGGAQRSIDLNQLSDRDLIACDGLLERWGYWESRSGQSVEKRIKFLSEYCGREIRSIVLALFEESKISQTIDQIVQFFLKTKAHHKEAFAGLLISSLCQRHVSWSSIVNWLGLNDGDLRRDIEGSEIGFLFKGGRDWNLFTSSQLADYVLRKKFVEAERDMLVKVYSSIVLKTADSANDERSGWDFKENLKELMKFRFLTRLFGDGDSSTQLIGQVYKRLSDAPRIRGNPQFWLQYAMSRMEIDDLGGAEKYIKTALSLAESRGKDYSPFQIIDQRARLFFMKNSRSLNGYSESEIRTACVDLMNLFSNGEYDIVYAMRSIPLIEDFLENHIDNVSHDIRERISAILEIAYQNASAIEKFPRSKKGETRVLKDSLHRARVIVFNA